MRSWIRLLLGGAVLTGCFGGVVASASAAEIGRLLDLWRVDELIISAQADCRDATATMLKGDLRLDEQRRRYRISPDDVDWHRLIEIYEEFFDNACAYISVAEQRAVYRRMLTERFSPPEINRLLAFYDSELGAKLIALELDANAQVQAVISNRHVSQVTKAQRIFEERLAELLRERAGRGRGKMKRTRG
ncbi:MAG: DUF2059 domain-containing protein [Gammaproteobacteria bacterium]|nr:DUF2059 domain-containing protein [Gammaproteobacteria bacterium]